MTDSEHFVGQSLPVLARKAVESVLKNRETEQSSHSGLERASFVTITVQGDLRGCIGSLEPCRDLIEDVRQNALAAALHDPRFPPLTAAELDIVRFEVSVLSPLEPFEVSSEKDLLTRIRPGVDGLVVEYRERRATFLPQVWEDLDTPETFLRHLRLKAGLPGHFWSDEMRFWTYRVDKFAEPESSNFETFRSP